MRVAQDSATLKAIRFGSHCAAQSGIPMDSEGFQKSKRRWHDCGALPAVTVLPVQYSKDSRVCGWWRRFLIEGFCAEPRFRLCRCLDLCELNFGMLFCLWPFHVPFQKKTSIQVKYFRLSRYLVNEEFRNAQ